MENGISNNIKKTLKIANKIGYPVLIRPSYVLGGRAMEIVYEKSQLIKFYLVYKCIYYPERIRKLLILSWHQ